MKYKVFSNKLSYGKNWAQMTCEPSSKQPCSLHVSNEIYMYLWPNIRVLSYFYSFFILNLSLHALHQTEFVPTLAAFAFCFSVFQQLKGKFTLKWKFSHYLPTHMLFQALFRKHFFFFMKHKNKKAPKKKKLLNGHKCNSFVWGTQFKINVLLLKLWNQWCQI